MKTIALNTKYSPNRGKVFGCTVEDYDRVIREPWLARAIDKIRGGDEDEKGRLPFMCPHFSEFKDNRRAQSCIIPEAFTWHTMVDIDDKEKVEGACEAALRLNMDEGSVWYHKLKLASYSARKKLHLFIEMPLGMTIHEAQVAYCKAIGAEADSDCETPERMIYLTDIRQEIYRSEDFLKPFSEEEIKERVEAMKGKAPFKSTAAPNPDPSPARGKGVDSINPEKEARMEGVQEEKVTTPSAPGGEEGRGEGAVSPSYLGIPYSAIIDKYWELHNMGRMPVMSNRDTLTYELAVNLRHICGFDEELMDRVIPCYDGFPQDQKMKCIRSAIETKRTQMPRKLREVLEALSGDNADVMDAIDRMKDEDDAMYARMLPVMPMGIRDCIEANGDALAMPSLLVSCSCIGALATAVKLKVHHKAKGLNIYPFVCGEFASGKGQMDQIYEEWTRDMQSAADEFYEREREWAKKAQTKKSGTTEKAPDFPVRILPLNNTLANISERLGNTKGKHAISFTPEADMVFSKWKGSMTDFSVMIRIAYDEARYDREAKSADAVRVHIPNLLWNVIMCGTQDSLYRLVTNMTDGFLSRLCICKTPDNTWERYQERDNSFTDQQCLNIHAMTKMLSLAEGTMEGEELEELGKAWLEEIRLTAIKSFDKVLARQRFRGCINAQRVAGAILLCKCLEYLYLDCESNMDKAESRLHRNPQCWMTYIDKCFEDGYMNKVFNVVADAMMDVTLYFFRDKLAEAYADKDYAKVTTGGVRSRKSANNSIFDGLNADFTFDQAMSLAVDIKGVNVTMNNVNQMLKNWKNQGLIIYNGDRKYSKIADVKCRNVKCH